MSDGDKAVNNGARNVHGGGVSSEHALLLRCRQRAEKYLREAIKQVFDKTDDLLFERSNKDEANGGGVKYFDALRELRVKRQDLTQKYLEGFAREHDSRLRRVPVTASKSAAQPQQGGGLSLIDEKELEESLAIEGQVGKANERFGNLLFALSQRYSVLVKGIKVEAESHPLAPDVICHAFRDAIGGIELSVEIKLIIYKLFEQNTVKQLGPVYEELNTLLADAGILPQLKVAAAVRTSDSGAEKPRPEASEAAPAATTTLPVPAASLPALVDPGEGDGDIYQTLQRLMNLKKYGAPAGGGAAAGGGSGGGSGGAGGGAAVLPPVPADALVHGLSLLQHMPPPPPEIMAGEAAIAYIKSGLLAQLGEMAAGKAIDPVTDNTIDVIGMIFEFIIDEPSIPELVKRLLNQLQIPILKVAIVDKEFFANKQHPARRLLNTLGHTSIGWNDKDETTQGRRFEKMEYTVGRVLKEYETDPGVFAELLADFTAFLASEGDDDLLQDEPDAETVAEETVAPPPGKHAFEAVELRLEGVEAPRIVREFLRNTWRRVLERVAASEGVEGDLWRHREQVLSDLLWSVEPKTGEDRRRMVALLPRLLGALQDGMQSVGCTADEMDAVLNGLEPIHMACLRGEAPPPDAPEPEAPPQAVEAARPPASDEVADMIRSIQQGLSGADPFNDDTGFNSGVASVERELARVARGGEFNRPLPEPEIEEEPLEAEEELIEDEFTEMTRDMAMGTWLEFELEGKKRRGKLGWKSAVMGEYVFVDRRYKVVAERTLAELAAELREGRARAVENVAMFDRALDAVMSGLTSGARG